MGDATYYPDRWHEYTKFMKNKGQKPDQNWAIFASRYRAAGNFIAADFFHLSERTKRSYSAAIGLLLSFSAFESACVASGLKTHGCFINDGGLIFNNARARLRSSFSKTPEHDFPLRWAISSEVLTGKIDDFLQGKEQDLRPIAAALRNLFAHGIYTPTGAGILNEVACEGIDFLGKCLLIKSDKLLESFIEQMELENKF